MSQTNFSVNELLSLRRDEPHVKSSKRKREKEDETSSERKKYRVKRTASGSETSTVMNGLSGSLLPTSLKSAFVYDMNYPPLNIRNETGNYSDMTSQAWKSVNTDFFSRNRDQRTILTRGLLLCGMDYGEFSFHHLRKSHFRRKVRDDLVAKQDVTPA